MGNINLKLFFMYLFFKLLKLKAGKTPTLLISLNKYLLLIDILLHNQFPLKIE
jgi:hypothetical protein